MVDFVALVIVAAVGGCTALLVWLVARPIVTLPAEDRRWMDPPPAAWRPLWPIARALAATLGTRLSVRRREGWSAQLRRAGLEFAVTPEQFLGVRMAHGAAGALLSLAMALSWDLRVGVPLAIGVLTGAALGALMPVVALRDRISARRHALVRGLPFCLDLITLCVEAGLNLQGAMAQAVAKGPRGPLRDELKRCLRDIRAGRSRAEALRGVAERCAEPSIAQFVHAVVQAEASGMNLGPVLRAQADQRRSERFLRAEKLAMQAPVKLLLPLIACVFPCTFAVLLFPIAMKFLQPGV